MKFSTGRDSVTTSLGIVSEGASDARLLTTRNGGAASGPGRAVERVKRFEFSGGLIQETAAIRQGPRPVLIDQTDPAGPPRGP